MRSNTSRALIDFILTRLQDHIAVSALMHLSVRFGLWSLRFDTLTKTSLSGHPHANPSEYLFLLSILRSTISWTHAMSHISQSRGK